MARHSLALPLLLLILVGAAGFLGTAEGARAAAYSKRRGSKRQEASRDSNPLLRPRGDVSPLDEGKGRFRFILQELDRAITLVGEGRQEAALRRDEALIATYGVNGVLDAIEDAYPLCHDEAHLVGRAAVRITSNVTELAQACGLRCHSGCFHGVVKGLVVDQPVIGSQPGQQQQQLAERAGAAFRALCNDPGIAASQDAGNCLHAMGHTAAMMSDDIGPAEVEGICWTVYAGAPRMQHQCGTGAFHQLSDMGVKLDCESAKLPGACYLIRLRGTFRECRNRPDFTEDVIRVGIREREHCASLTASDAHRAGCVHGLMAQAGKALLIAPLGRSPQLRLAAGKRGFAQLCLSLQGELLAACVEGFLLFNPEDYPEGTADAICSQLSPRRTSYTEEMCRRAAGFGLATLDRFTERYVVPA